MDPLSDVLQAVRLSGALFFLVDASSPWVADVPSGERLSPELLPEARHLISYHVVTGGGCWGALVGEPATRLEAGDVLVIPHGDAYVLSTAPVTSGPMPLEQSLSFFRAVAAGELPLVLEDGGGGRDHVRLMCGFLGCDPLPFHPILGTLPPWVHVRGQGDPDERLSHLIDLARIESRETQAGRASVLLRISELLFIEILRRYLADSPRQSVGWLAGLRDPVVGRALERLHREPARPWTLESLAREVGTSRSTLSERFSRLVGQPPMRYLSRWRMQVAAGHLSEGAKVSAVALDVGYDSEAAFSRAFKKVVGSSPSEWRNGRARSVGTR